ncbi:MAG: hypothetical protein ACOH18_00285 [Candidatus Saccharimonadaceae bacterium]
MHTIRIILRRGILYVLTFVLVAGYPFAAMADTQEPTTDSSPSVTTPAETPVETPPTAEQTPPLTYTYNADTQKWNSEDWQFNPQTGAYEKPPAPVIIEPKVVDSPDTSVDKTINTTVTVDNNVRSDATSGDAAISSNTAAGSALTGDAATVANIMNAVNSTITTGENQKIATFTQDIMGDVKGDIVLYPLLLKAMLEAKANPSPSTTINATTNFDVNNTVDLAAKTGNAMVDSNTTAGNATTGSATAVANVVNILNSMIAAQDSFIGTINIYGNLEGDILVAPDFIPQMLANNGSNGDDSKLKVSNQDTTTIVNNISAVAESGAASVFGNTTAGDGTTGDASSNIVIFNISGHEIIAKNSLLVFVNVLGKWVGMIVDAPAGATAAMLGNDVTTNSQYAPDLTVNSQSSQGITNTIAVSAKSGDAVVSNNTTAGNAISGQARAMANVANISGSQFGLSDWFGVLFINVYQNWYGSFGIDTPYGNAPMQATEAPTGPIQFIPAKTQASQTDIKYKIIDSRNFHGSGSTVESKNTQAVLASAPSSLAQHTPTDSSKKVKAPQNSYDYRLWVIAGSVFVVGACAMGIRRLLQ